MDNGRRLLDGKAEMLNGVYVLRTYIYVLLSIFRIQSVCKCT
jgi:hypothetical protein